MIKDKEKQKEHARKHYLANKEKMKERAKEWTKKQIAKNKEYIRNFLLDHPCVNCGNDDIRVLEFDHMRDKVADISYATFAGWSTERLQEEIDKCQIRCANCHRIKTFNERNSK